MFNKQRDFYLNHGTYVEPSIDNLREIQVSPFTFTSLNANRLKRLKSKKKVLLIIVYTVGFQIPVQLLSAKKSKNK